jgi:diglucosylglycerate octanoyltransferase
MSSEQRTRPALLVFADSLAYYGPTGGLPSDDPRIWPNIVASQLGWDLELIGRIGWTCRDVWWAATQDPRAWAALPRAGAVIFATGGMDSLPSPLPTALRELIRYVRPAWLRRWVRDGYGWVQPRLSPVARAALPPHLSAEYLEQTRGAIDFNRPGIPIVASLPSVHIAETYGKAHHGRAGTVAAITQWAQQHDIPLVDLKSAVAEHVMSGRGNPDGIHWNFEAHQAVAELMLKALAEARAATMQWGHPQPRSGEGDAWRDEEEPGNLAQLAPHDGGAGQTVLHPAAVDVDEQCRYDERNHQPAHRGTA